MYTFLIFVISFLVTFFATGLIYPGLKKNLVVGRDVNKPGNPEVPEMGGIIIVLGFCAGIVTTIGLKNWSNVMGAVDSNSLTMALLTTYLVFQLGAIDDLAGMSQSVKAVTPLFASIPLIMAKAGHTTMRLPFLGPINFGPLYTLVFIPLGVTGAANGVNMLAGFNGLEVGMGIVALGSLAIIAYSIGAATSFLILVAALGALIGTIYYNWYPAKILIGDVGTLSIGAIIASAVIIGNFEAAGVIIFIPYLIDFVIKAANRFPGTDWWGKYSEDDGKLYCPNPRPVSLCQWVMKLAGGIHERMLVLLLIGIEAIFGLIAILLFAKF